MSHFKLTYFDQFAVLFDIPHLKLIHFGQLRCDTIDKHRNWPKWISLRCGTIYKHKELTKIGQFDVWNYLQTQGIDQSGSAWGVTLSTNTRNVLKWPALRCVTINKYRKLTNMGQIEVWHYRQIPHIEQTGSPWGVTLSTNTRNGLKSPIWGVALSTNIKNWPKWVSLKCGTIYKH